MPSIGPQHGAQVPSCNTEFQFHAAGFNFKSTAYEWLVVSGAKAQYKDVVIRGISLDKNQAKVTLVAVPDKPGVAASIFKAIGDANVNVDMIVQNISHGCGTPATD